MYRIASEGLLPAHSVEKVALVSACLTDSISLLIWEIDRDDGTKERSSSCTVL